MKRVLTIREIAQKATETLCTFTDDKPDLIKTGIGPLDCKIGGLFPGQVGIIGMATGIGKSSTLLSAMLQSSSPIGLISLEDAEDVLGSRALAFDSGVNSLSMRRKDFSLEEEMRMLSALGDMDKYAHVHAVCHPGASLESVEDYLDQMHELGVRMVYIDYIQALRGHSEDRRNEVSTSFTKIIRKCAEHGMAAMVASQFSRQVDGEKRPKRSWLKESGDLENEARVIVLGWRDSEDPDVTHYVLDKSSVGGEGVHWSMRRDESGTLRSIDKPKKEDW